MSEEEGSVSVATISVSPAAPILPTSFVAWEVQGPAKADNNRSVYAAFSDAEEEYVRELLSKITSIKKGEYINLVLCLEIEGGHPAPHMLPLDGFGVGTGIPREDSEVRIYAWALDISTRQETLNLQVYPAWILSIKDQIKINNVATVDTMLQDTDPSNMPLVLDKSVATKMCEHQ